MVTPVYSREEEIYWLALKLVPGLGTRTSGKSRLGIWAVFGGQTDRSV